MHPRRALPALRPILLSALLPTLLVASLAGCSGSSGTSGTTVTVTAPSPAAGSGPSSPASPSSTSGPTASPGGTGAIQVPVYYVAEALPRLGPRLYREFRTVPTQPGGRIATAVHAMLTLSPLDPDYRSDWAAAGVTLRAVTTSGAVATVDLSGWVAVGAAAESTAVQQLVHTVTAAEPSITSVRVLVAGATPPSGHLDLSRPLTRARALDILALVWILEPTQGAVGGSPVTVRIYGTGFEGTIPVKVFRDGGVVTSTVVTTRMGELAEASTSIMLSPGSYEIRAYNENMENGALDVWDSKAFTVR